MSTKSNSHLNCHNPENNLIPSSVKLDEYLINLEQEKQNLIIEIENNIRQVNLAFYQATQATRATKLTQKQLKIEQEKQRSKTRSLEQLINFKNNLVEAQTQEINAIIDYINALTNLQQKRRTLEANAAKLTRTHYPRRNIENTS